MPDIYQWAIFGVVLATAVVADIVLFHRKAHRVSVKEALAESAGWIGLSIAFSAWIYYSRGQEAGLQFLTAYLVEKSLSLDNILIFILIFGSLGVPAKAQHKVLFYGVAGALVMRGIFVAAGIELLQKFHAVLFLFGVILLATAARMLLPSKRKMQPEKNWLVRLARLIVPVSDEYADDKFWVKDKGGRKATGLFVALIAVEAMDIVFAVDSVPAVLAITRDPLIAYSSNVFAVLGLRALYFALSGALTRVRYLHQGLAVILVFVSAKMLGGEHFRVSTGMSLGAIGGILFATIAASMGPWARKEE